MSGSIYAYPDVYPVTQDQSSYVASGGASVGVAVGACDKGPVMTRTPVTSTRTFINLFGNPNPLTSYMHYSVIPALQEMSLIYVTRVVGAGATMAAVGVGHATNYSNTYTTGIVYPFVSDTTLFAADTATSLVFYANSPGVWGNTLSIYIDNVTAASGASPDSFDITVYQNINGVNIIQEKLAGASTYKYLPNTSQANLDGYGHSRFVEDVVNTRSNYISVSFNVNALSPTPSATLTSTTLTTSATTASGGTTLTFAATTGVTVGQTVVGTGIATGTQVTGVTSTTVTLGSATTGSVASGATITFQAPGTPVALVGGANGAAVSEANVAAGWDLYSDRNTIAVDLLLNCGYATDTTFAVQIAIDGLAQKRQDCFGILDIPYDKQNMSPTTDLTNWRNYTQNLNSSFSALYTGWPLVWDSINDIHRMPVPVCGFAAQVFARRDYRKGVIWYPPAGMQDGLLASGVFPVEGLSVYYDEGVQGLIYQAGINYVRMFIGGGYAIWGQKTLQYLDSALNRINVRRLLIDMVRSIRKFLLAFVFELNNTFTRLAVKNNIDQYMQYVQGNNGVYQFLTVCDTTNNSPFDIDNNRLNVEVRIQPQKSIEFIIFTTTIQKTGGDLNATFSAVTTNSLAL